LILAFRVSGSLPQKAERKKKIGDFKKIKEMETRVRDEMKPPARSREELFFKNRRKGGVGGCWGGGDPKNKKKSDEEMYLESYRIHFRSITREGNLHGKKRKRSTGGKEREGDFGEQSSRKLLEASLGAGKHWRKARTEKIEKGYPPGENDG